MSEYTLETKTLRKIVTQLARVKINRVFQDAIRFEPEGYWMRVYRSNGSERLDASFPIADVGGAPFALDLKSLRAALKVAGDSITLAPLETQGAEARYDGGRRFIEGYAIADLPEWERLTPERYLLDEAERSHAFESGAALREKLAWVSSASSKDETRFNLMSVFWDSARENPGAPQKATLPDDAPRFVATDGHRLHTDTIAGEWCVGETLPSHMIPLAAVNAFCGAFGKGKAMASTPVNWYASPEAKGVYHIIWRSLGIDFAVSYCEIDGDYPNWRQVYPNVTSLSLGFQADDASKAFRAHADRFCKLTANDTNGASLTSGDDGEMHSHFHAQGASMIVGFNARYLAEALDGFGSKRVQIHCKAPEERDAGQFLNPFRMDSMGERCAVVMPARI